MSAVTQQIGAISVQDYLQGELASEVRHEFLDGHVYAMAGASDTHNRIALNIVVCDAGDKERYFRERPAVIFEVISPQTERVDRHEKALAYREIASVKACVIVEQDRVAITVLHRSGDDWRSEVVEGTNAVLKLPMIGVEIPFERIYERTGLV